MSAGLSPGGKVRVKSGVQAPDLPEFSLAGWTGTVTQVTGKKGAQKVFIEWDEATLGRMDANYLKACEEKQLYHLMACLTAEELEPAE